MGEEGVWRCVDSSLWEMESQRASREHSCCRKPRLLVSSHFIILCTHSLAPSRQGIPEASSTWEKAKKNPMWNISHIRIEFSCCMRAAKGIYDLAKQASGFEHFSSDPHLFSLIGMPELTSCEQITPNAFMGSVFPCTFRETMH